MGFGLSAWRAQGPEPFSLQPATSKAQSPEPKACNILPVPRVTVTIITKNEAAHIGAAIDSASWADEIVVVDSDSTDETRALAAAKGVRVENRTWSGWVDGGGYCWVP